MTGTLTFAFVGLAVLCIVAGVVAVTRTRRAARHDEAEFGAGDDEMTYAEEAAAVAAAQAAAAESEAAEPDGAPGAARDHESREPPTA